MSTDVGGLYTGKLVEHHVFGCPGGCEHPAPCVGFCFFSCFPVHKDLDVGGWNFFILQEQALFALVGVLLTLFLAAHFLDHTGIPF